jgi:hypothetical protein
MENDKKNGALTRAFVNFNGEEIELKLAVIKRSKIFYGHPEELSFVSNERPHPKIVVKSLYSGGLTGSGIDSWSLRDAMEGGSGSVKEEVEVIAVGALAAFQWIEKQEKIEKEKRENFIAKQNEAVTKLNEQPKYFPIEGLSSVRIRRSDATFSAGRSRSIQYGVVVEIKKDDLWNQVYMDFTTKDGKLKVKKFEEEMQWLFGESTAKTLDPRETLKKIVAAKKYVKALCREITPLIY